MLDQSKLSALFGNPDAVLQRAGFYLTPEERSVKCPKGFVSSVAASVSDQQEMAIKLLSGFLAELDTSDPYKARNELLNFLNIQGDSSQIFSLPNSAQIEINSAGFTNGGTMFEVFLTNVGGNILPFGRLTMKKTTSDGAIETRYALNGTVLQPNEKTRISFLSVTHGGENLKQVELVSYHVEAGHARGAIWNLNYKLVRGFWGWKRA